jgi:2-polyprenyl-6-hydroxyphenyl methylase/3-demethylubiquinone-9 3-methyltransferase
VPGIAEKARELVLRATGRWTPENKWNSQFASGRWEYLANLNERARYSVLAGYVHALKPGGRVLDVGCGTGLLRERLHPDAFARYVGVDFEEAVSRATHLSDERTTFVSADMHEFVPDGRFDIIVFNESSYYFRDPADGVRRYESYLDADGFILMSMHISPKADEAWLQIGPRYEIIDEVLIANRDGTSWICRVMRPPSND